METRATFRGLQRLFGEGGDLFRELDDVDLFAAKLADDGLHAHALHADAGADRVDILVAGHDGDLGALTGFAGDGADGDGAVVDLRDFALEEVLDEAGAARETMTCGPLAARSTRSRTTRTRSPTENCSRRDCSRLGMRASALPRSKMTSMGSRRLTVALRTSPGAVVVLEEDGVALGFANLLEDDLLGHLGGDAA